MSYFDYETTAKEAGLNTAQLDAVRKAVRSDFPHDDMMFELHVLRVCMAIRDGHLSVEDALREPASMTGT